MTELEELLLRVQQRVIEDGDCWIWQGAKQANGSTPSMQWKGKVNSVRRFILMAKGQLVKGWMASTHCGNPHCVNPDHIAKVNRKTLSIRNAAEMDILTRTMRAKRTAEARREGGIGIKLNPELAESIRNDSRPTRTIAAEYGVSQYAVCCVKTGRTWRNYASTNNPFAQLMR